MKNKIYNGDCFEVKMKKILIACEKSQIITTEFRKSGFEAYSCDILPTDGNPEWHYQMDILKLLKEENFDLVIAHPPCTFLTVSNTYIKRGCKKYTPEQATEYRKNAINFFMQFVSAKCDKIAIENPIGIMSSLYRKPDQIIQPYEFGHPESKATCLWLKNLPLLKPTKYAEFKRYRCKCGNTFEIELGKYGCCDYPAKPLWDNQTKSGQNKLPPSEKRQELRAKTYKGIAEAMAFQWSNLI